MGSQSKTHKFRFYRARLLISLALLFLPLSLSAQLAGTTELSSSFVEKGEIFSVKFIFANDISTMLRMTEPELPEGLAKVGDSILSFDTRENQTKMEITFRATEEGFLTIPSFLFREGRREEWKSEPLSIGVSVRPLGAEGEIPLELELRLAKTNLYANESIGLGLFVVGNQRLTFLDVLSLQANFPVNLKVVRVPLFWEMRTEKKGSRESLVRPLANWIVTPLEVGEITLPTMSLEKDGERYQTKPLSLQVKDQTSEVKAGAIGKFDMTTGINSREVAGSGTVEVTVAITGEGNFNQFDFLGLSLEGGVVVGMGEENSLQPTEKGYKGSLFRIYKIAPTGSSNLQITIPNWTYWDSETGTFHEISGSSYAVRVVGSVQSPPLSLQEKTQNLSFLKEEEMRSQKFSFFFVNPLYYLALIPGLALGIFLYFKRTLWRVLSGLGVLVLVAGLVGLFSLGERRVTRSQDSLETLDWNNFEGQEETYLLEIDNLLASPAPPYYRANLFYNKGILLFKMGQNQEAIGALYSSLNQAPLHSPARDALSTMSLSLGKNEIISFQNIYWLNWFFLGVLLTYNLIWLALFAFQSDRISRFFALLILSCLMVAGFISLFSLSRPIYAPLGVLHGSMISVSKVPDFFTRSWIFVNGGLAVYLMEETDYFYRIILPSGIQGWVEKSAVWEIQ